MKQRHLFTLINLSALVLGAVLWVLSVATDGMGDFGFAWVAFIVTAIWAVSFTARVFVEKNTMMKKSWAILSGVCYVAAAGSLIGALALEGNLVLPIICLAVAFALLVGSVVLGGKKWDEGDNQKPGYKTYRERKAEEEAQKAEAESAQKSQEGQE